MTPMARICAWCQLVISDGSHPATHGICPACIARLTDQTPLVEIPQAPVAPTAFEDWK